MGEKPATGKGEASLRLVAGGSDSQNEEGNRMNEVNKILAAGITAFVIMFCGVQGLAWGIKRLPRFEKSAKVEKISKIGGLNR